MFLYVTPSDCLIILFFYNFSCPLRHHNDNEEIVLFFLPAGHLLGENKMNRIRSYDKFLVKIE